jgi:hypothetical protein
LGLAAPALPFLGCQFRHPLGVEDCTLDEPASAVSAREAGTQSTAPPVDLSGLKLYRNTFLVDRVGPYEHHFSLWYDHIEPNFARVRARIDPATGRAHVAIDNEAFGDVFPPKAPRPTPPQVADLARALDREVRRRCPDGRKWVVQYEGQYREVDLMEMTLLKAGSAPEIGWHGYALFPADEALTHQVAGPIDYMSGLALLDAAGSAQWVDFVPPAESMGTTLFVDRLARSKEPPSPPSADAVLVQRALDAARRMASKQPSLRLSDILAAQGETLLPPGMDQRLLLDISFYARPKPELRDTIQQSLDLIVELKTAEAVHGVSHGAASGTIGGVYVKATAVLSALQPLGEDAPSGPNDVAALLQLHVEDGQGHLFDRSYPAKAVVVVDGHTVATGGFGLSPGPGWPTVEQDAAQGIGPARAFHGTLPGRGPYSVVDFYVSTGVSEDPRWR